MFMPIATYSFFAQADRVAAHVRGAGVDTADENVTLVEGHAR